MTAAWVASTWFEKVHGIRPELVPAKYGDAPPDVAGAYVIVCDFSYSRAGLEKMHDDAVWMRVFDHHKTAQAALKGLDYCVFDMERSGAGITWDELFGVDSMWRAKATREGWTRQSRPWLVDYVEDRDLWRYALPRSREVSAWIATCLEFQGEAVPGWVDASWSLHPLASAAVLQVTGLDAAANNGANVLEFIGKYARTVAATAQETSFCGHHAVLVNCAYERRSDVLELLNNRGHVVAIGWHQGADGSFEYSLRSQGAVDVSELAKEFGGGGHANAAGFRSRVLHPWTDR
jgi:oligoribonuclease NrnB/cAMP/cGMP phosphodiesterase (DHH superfamily)